MDYGTDLVKKHLITRIEQTGHKQIEDVLLREDRWHLFCDGEQVSIHNCLSLGLKQMAVGQLRYREIIQSADEIEDIHVNEAQKTIEARLRGAGRPAREQEPKAETREQTPKAEAQASFSARDIHRLQDEFNRRCGLFRYTGSAHSCAVADVNGILCYFEDVARHNAMDKVLGEFLLQNMDADGKALLFSGRLALDMLEKAIATGVKVLISPGAPTLAAVEAAEAHGLTLLGFVRPDNINIYTNPERITPQHIID